MDDTEEPQEQPPILPPRGKKESVGVPSLPAPGGSRRRPQQESTTPKSSPASEEATSPESLQPPSRVVENRFGVEDVTNKVVREGILGLNLLVKRYFVLYGSGTLQVFKNANERKSSKTAEEFNDKLLTISPCHSKKRKGDWVTFHFSSGLSKDYRTTDKGDQDGWIQAGQLLKAE